MFQRKYGSGLPWDNALRELLASRSTTLICSVWRQKLSALSKGRATQTLCSNDNLYSLVQTYICLCTLGVYLVVEDQRHRHALHKANSSQPPDAYHEHYPHVRDVEMSDRLPATLLPIFFLSMASPSRRVPGYHYLPLSTPNTRQALSVHKMHSRSRSAR